MELAIHTTSKSYLRYYLELLNGILKLTPRELDALLLFIEFDKVIACSRDARVYVASQMNFKTVTVVNNYVKNLKDKGVIVYDSDKGGYTYNAILTPPDPSDGIKFKFVIE
jgi:hypothetical protein